MLLATLALGAAIGLVLGGLGGGGSVLTVPALVFALGLRPQDATTASLVIVGITAVVAAVGHARRGNTRWGQGLLLAVAGVPASVVGTQLNRLVDGNVLLLAFSALMLVAAIGMLLRSGSGQRPQPDAELPPGALPGTRTASGQALGNRAASDSSASPRRSDVATLSRPVALPQQLRWSRVLGAGLLIGGLTGFFGVGGGFVIVPVLVVGLGFEMPAAVGTSLLVIALSSTVALAARAGQGGFDWSVIVPFTGAAVVASLVGQRVAGRLPSDALTRVFAVLLVLLAVYVAIRAVLGLR